MFLLKDGFPRKQTLGGSLSWEGDSPLCRNFIRSTLRINIVEVTKRKQSVLDRISLKKD